MRDRMLCASLAGALLATAGAAMAAEVRDVSLISLASEPLAMMVQNIPAGADAGPFIARAIGLDVGSSLDAVQVLALPNAAGATIRYNQTYLGVPVWGQQVIVDQAADGSLMGVSGTAAFEIAPDDTPRPEPALSAGGALERAKAAVAQLNPTLEGAAFENEESELVYFVQQSGDLRLVYRVTFFTTVQDETGSPAPIRPVYFIDANSGETVDSYDNLQHGQSGTGPGGNLKTSQYNYGTGTIPKFDVAEQGTSCSMDSINVFSENLNHGGSGTNAPYQYSCYNNVFQNINGAYAPLNDAQSFGQVVFDMYRDWYNTSPLTQKLQMRVHYLSQYENAFWNGSSMTFGDGKDRFHPLVSLDVSAHEVSHGFTEQNSGLIYSGQSGGINEAFSDMAGEAAEYFYFTKYGALFTRPMPDLEVGADIFKQPGKALRYMCDPPKDGNSIGNAADYRDGMDVHFSSGVFNKAFCILSKRGGWNVRKAFDVFVVANQRYWTPNSTFQSGAEGVLKAAGILQYPAADVVESFRQVGIVLASAPAKDRYFYSTLRVITDGAPRGCGYGGWDCMTNLCKADLQDQSAWRGWAGCWQKSGKFICYFECGQVRKFF